MEIGCGTEFICLRWHHDFDTRTGRIFPFGMIQQAEAIRARHADAEQITAPRRSGGDPGNGCR
ncbi:MAG: hypothetical protein MZV65_00595 [Chromatiales bacterium]|nr:hypothetical protein [Chromatiales bacterium]